MPQNSQKNTQISFVFETVVRYSFDAVQITDLHGKIIYVNPSFSQLTGYSAEEVIGQNANILKSEVTSINTFKEMWNTVLAKNPWRGEIVNKKKNGELFLSELTVAPISDEKSGEIISLLGTQRDITEKRKLEEEFKKYNEKLEKRILERTQALQNSEKNYRDLLDNSPEMINVINEDGFFQSVNTTQLEKLETDAKSLSKKSFTDICIKSESSKLIDFFNNVKKNGSGFTETILITSSKKQLTVQIFAKAIYDKNGNYKKTRNYMSDITERKSFEQSLLQTEKLSAIGQLAVGIAHEVGNPLAAISSIVQILEMESNQEFFTKKLSSIRHEINRIASILKNLVDFSRPKKSTAAKINVNSIISETAKIITYDKRAKHIDFIVSLNEKIPNTHLIPDEIMQVLINLLLNAVDAIGEKNGKIIISSDLGENFIQIGIQDNGHGISQSNLNKIFNPFFTTKEVGKGTGLGLWISHGIIESLKGKILVDSKIGEGTEFKILLPIL